MTKGSRTIVAMLAAVAVLLGLDLLSEAGASDGSSNARQLVAFEAKHHGNTLVYYRAWSDGTIEVLVPPAAAIVASRQSGLWAQVKEKAK